MYSVNLNVCIKNKHMHVKHTETLSVKCSHAVPCASTGELRKIEIPSKMLDVLSGSYYLRSIAWSLGDMAEFNLYTDDKVYNFIGLLFSQTQITIPKRSQQNAYLLKPYMFIDGQQITKVSTEVFFSTSETKKPLQALLKTPSGNVLLMLTNVIEDK
jgi:hypothetical protein